MSTHRTRAWTSADTREVILDAAYEHLKQAALSREGGPFPELSIPLVAQKAAEYWAERHPDKPRELGIGAVRRNFPGGQPGLVMATIRDRVGLSEVADSVAEFQDSLTAAQDTHDEVERHCQVRAALRQFVAHDLNHAAENTETTVYLNLLAHHMNEDVQQLVHDIYQQFDKELQPLYRRMLKLLNLRLRHPFQIEQFAAGMTAIAEGLGVRSVVDHASSDGIDFERTAEALANGLILTMTEPA